MHDYNIEMVETNKEVGMIRNELNILEENDVLLLEFFDYFSINILIIIITICV